MEEKFADNEYLCGRGVAGTHDMPLAVDTLRKLILESTNESRIMVPQYDKSAYSGKGDRAKAGKVVEGKVDLVIVEGWMLGYKRI